MFKISNIRIEIGEEISAELIGKRFSVSPEDISDICIVKKSLDARKKKDIHYNLTVSFCLKNEKKYINNKSIEKYNREEYVFDKKCPPKRPLIVGSGPCGLFAALCLSRAGAAPLLIERGASVYDREKAVRGFFDTGRFSPSANVQFGEGGAGTFSDGKLTTGRNDIRIGYILSEFVRFGAPEEILYSAKPHIGTDRLIKVVKNIREEIKEKGGEVRFMTRLSDIGIKNGKVCSAVLSDNTGEREEACSDIILAVGHSARDTFKMLKMRGAEMERKTFSAGVRIEHLQENINRAQYGKAAKYLPPADYKLAVKTKDGRGVYTFCMCPGGYVVAAASEEGGICTNGMSLYARNAKNANSALLVTVEPKDIPGEDVLGGIYFQREMEKRAYELGGGGYIAPAMTAGAFLERGENIPKSVIPSYRPGVRFCDIREIFPDFIAKGLSEGLILMEKKLPGFADNEAVLTAPEARSSSPIRIVRGENGMSNIKGLYPCGEGAGYAGGIMSAALDGIKTAERYIENNL